ncbi:MAG TPA: cupredoxin domain-containing protein [Caulobacteraceae bacterium]|jgi:plastocyanin|nr:cupredoxin domain-containing protein [Caulobacteraceae bacterium]
MKTAFVAFALGLAAATAASAAPLVLTLENHRFTPSAITVPAGRKIEIQLINLDPAVEEFDSRDLRVEEDVTPHGRTSFTVGPLKPGAYSFMGEFHAGTAEGVITAR